VTHGKRTKPIVITRINLSEDECARIMAGLLGSLSQNAGVGAVRNAVRRLASNDELWAMFEQMALNVNKIVDSGGSVPDTLSAGMGVVSTRRGS